MRKRIAVFICAISFDNQRNILLGILDGAKEMDTDVYVFTCHLNYMESASNKQGAFHIMDLPNLHTFDGAIVVKNTIQDSDTAERLMERIAKSEIPVVCIDERVPQIPCVGISDYEAQKAIVTHLIERHQMSHINYVTGHIYNREGMERYQAYRDALTEHKIPFAEEQIYYGNYDIDSGHNAVKQFMREGKLPEAIVCANDSMAIGVLEELLRAGYHCPQDVAVTGFDNDAMAKYHHPSLTTVDRNQGQIGYQAVKRLLIEPWEKKQQFIKLEASIVYRESCGCSFERTWGLAEVEAQLTSQHILLENAVDSLKNMTAELAVMEELADLYEALKKYVLTTDMQSFYLCMCDTRKIFEPDPEHIGEKEDAAYVCNEYSPQVTIPLAYHNGEFSAVEAFASGSVLPRRLCDTDAPGFYIVTPLNYRDWCFGYIVSVNSYFALYSELFYSWIMNVGIGLENVRKWKLMDAMVARLNSVWAYDALTHLYNRAGFFQYAREFVAQCAKKQERMYLLFLDMDGLKQVNDNLGHEFGDQYIAKMAEVLKECIPKNDMVMRYGGDEFVVLGRCSDSSTAAQRVGLIRASLQRINELEKQEYRMEASIGVSEYLADENMDLGRLLEEADQRMYEEKKNKKKQRVQKQADMQEAEVTA